MEKILTVHKEWVVETWNKILKKLSVTAIASREKIPYTTINGIHDSKTGDKDIEFWTNGFWPGLMWLMYVETKDERYKITAEAAEEKLDKALQDYMVLHHDVGFMWLISSGVNYRLFGSEKSKNRTLFAASTLASRYNLSGKFIRAWNGENNKGWVIIDCMMNLPLLYWASNEIDDERFAQIAISHANSTMKNHIRADGSVYHILECDTNTGEVIGMPRTQGYEPMNSSWSRGQSWAIYGFVLCYIHTGKKEYLDVAKKVAHYFISAVICNDYIPKCDFRQPEIPDYIDTTSGAIAACGLIEIAKCVPEFEKNMYIDAAVKILKVLEKEHCDWSEKQQAILLRGTESYKANQHIPIIYGDYFFVEAILKLKGSDILFW